jgi:hypothetical protein
MAIGRKKIKGKKTVYLDDVVVIEQSSVDELKAAIRAVLAEHERCEKTLGRECARLTGAVRNLRKSVRPWTIP